MMTETTTPIDLLDPIENGVSRLTRADILTAAQFSREQARSLVDLYYGIQKVRVAAGNKVSAGERRVDLPAEPLLIVKQRDELLKVEKQTARGLKAYAEAQPLGRWAMSNLGVGPVICSGLLAHIDCERAPTAGAIWKFAGLLPPEEIAWEKGERRPYNARLKVLCWKLGEAFKKVSNHPGAYYGKLYRERKEQEVERNAAGAFADVALARLARAIKGKWRISPEQRKLWSEGRIQDRGLDLRAMRHAVKIFLSHYHQVGREMLGLPLVKPWVIEHGGHVHYLPPPNWKEGKIEVA